MALRCTSRYRGAYAGRVYHVEPGELLTTLDADEEAFLLRDSPGSFESYDPPAPTAAAKAAAKASPPDAPPAHRMVERERAARKESERTGGVATGADGGGAMSRTDHPGLSPKAKG